MASDPGDWSGTPEAAELLTVTLRTGYRMIDEGKLTNAREDWPRAPGPSV
jgi:hypothetical protein